MSQMLDVGTHNVRVANCQFTQGGDGKQDQLAIRFEDDAGDGISWYHSLGWLKDGTYSPKSAKFAFDALANLGWDVEARGYAFEELNGADSPLIGREAEIVVVDEPYNGKSQIKVKWINDPNRPRAGAERMEPGAAKTFAERTRDALRKAGKNVPAVASARPRAFGSPPPASKPAAGGEEINFSDIPF